MGARKATTFLQNGARVTGIAPQFCSQWPMGAARLDRTFQAGDCANFALVVAATDNPDLNRWVAREARGAGAWCNDASDPESSDFHTVAVVKRGQVVVGISTSGLSPILSRHLRERVEAVLGPEYEQLQEMVSHCAIESQQRAEFWRRLLSTDVLEKLRAGHRAQAESTLLLLTEDLQTKKQNS